MSTRAKTFATVAAIAAVVVAFGGTAQAQPAIATIPNYNFSQWDELTDYGALRDWNGPGGVGHYDHYTSMPDGMMTPYNTEGPQLASGYDEGYASNWYNATDPYSTELVVWNPTTTANAAPTYLTGYQYDATLSSPPPPEQRTPIGSNPVTAIGGPVTPRPSILATLPSPTRAGSWHSRVALQLLEGGQWRACPGPPPEANASSTLPTWTRARTNSMVSWSLVLTRLRT